MTPPKVPETFQPVAMVLAYLVPGAGYLWFGQRSRALYFFLGVAGLLVGGLLIGGLDVVDRDNDGWWFLVQAGAGPASFGLDRIRAGMVGGALVPSVGKVNEVGTLFVVMAGLLNLLAVIDCAWHAPRGASGDRRGGASS